MPAVQRETVVNTPPEKAFAYLSDFQRHPEWAAHRLEVQPEPPGDLAVGSTFRSVGHEMGTHRALVTVTELVPNQRIVYEAEDDTGRFRHHIAVQVRDGQTVIAKGVETLRLSLMLKLLTPLFGIMIPRSLDGDLRRIKEKLEAQA